MAGKKNPMQYARHSSISFSLPAGERRRSRSDSSQWMLRLEESYPAVSLEKSPPATGAWETNSSSASVLRSSETRCPGDEQRDVSARSASNVDAGPGGCLWGGSCAPGDCRDARGAALPLCPHEGPRESCKDVRTISIQDHPYQIVPLFSCTVH